MGRSRPRVSACGGGMGSGAGRASADGVQQPGLGGGVAPQQERAHLGTGGDLDLYAVELDVHDVPDPGRCGAAGLPPGVPFEPVHWFFGHPPQAPVVTDGQRPAGGAAPDVDRDTGGAFIGCCCCHGLRVYWIPVVCSAAAGHGRCPHPCPIGHGLSCHRTSTALAVQANTSPSTSSETAARPLPGSPGNSLGTDKFLKPN